MIWLIAALLLGTSVLFLCVPLLRQKSKQRRNVSVFYLPLLFAPLFAIMLAYPAFDRRISHQSLQQELRQKTAAQILVEELSRLTELLKQNPTDAKLRLDIGSIYFLLRDHAQARAVLHHPSLQSNEKALALLLSMHYQSHSQDDGEKPDWQGELTRLMQRLEKLNPSHPLLLAILAEQSLATGDSAAASRHWRRLLEQETTDEGRERIMQFVRNNASLIEQSPSP